VGGVQPLKIMLVAALCWAAGAALSRVCAQPAPEPTPAPVTTPAPSPQPAPQPALPKPPTLFDTLTLDPGATCLDRDRLIRRIVRWRESAEIDASLRVRVRGDAHDPTRVYFSVVRADTTPSERVIENAPADCDQLHSAIALSIALALDALIANAGDVPLPAAVKEPAKAGANNAGSQLSVELALLGGASVGVVPNTAVALAPRIHVTPFPWLSFALAGIATGVQGLTIGNTSGRFDATVIAGGLDICSGGEASERLTFYGCAGVRGGLFSTNAFDYAQNEQKNSPWWAVVVSGQARAWILPTVGIAISIEGLFALAPRELVLRSPSPDLPEQHRSVSQVGLGVTGGPVFRFF
jgi:hypothetical protein